MNILVRIFNYPSKHYFISLFSLFGFSLAVLADKNIIDYSFFMQFLVGIGMVMAAFMVEDIYSIYTGAKNSENLAMIQVKMSKLRNIQVLTVCIFLVVSFFKYHFDYSYEHMMTFLFTPFQFGSALVFLRAYAEKKRRLMPATKKQ